MKKCAIDYHGIESFTKFCSDVSEMSREYRYVAAKERRGFNLIYRFWTGQDNLITTTGLLLRYKDIAEEYRVTRRFPRVLILDDLAIYGREIMKAVLQFRQAVWEYLEEDVLYENSIEQFDLDFYRSVHIYVYAASRKCKLLTQGLFYFRTFLEGYSSMCTIHDLSMQFSYALMESEVANACYSFSARSEALWKRIEAKEADLPKGWSRVVMDQEGEQILVFLRPWGNGHVSGISTIRVFPERARHDIPQITSFPLIGLMEETGLSELYNQGIEVAAEHKLSKIAELLAEEARCLQPARAQLGSLLISILDFFDFCHDFLEPDEYEDMQEDLRCDIDKISCNFGGDWELFEDLMTVVFSIRIKKDIKTKLFPLLEKCAQEIIPISTEELTGIDLTIDDTAVSKGFVDVVSRLAYDQGARNEEFVQKMLRRIHFFNAMKYQEIMPVLPTKGRRGVVPLQDACSQIVKSSASPQYTCGIVASLVGAMDRGLIGPMENVRKNGDTSLFLKAGELSTFYGMKKLADFIPALSMIEEYYYRRADSKQAAVFKFLETYETVYDYVRHIYAWGQTFHDWNFDNLVRTNGDEKRTAQMVAAAKDFLMLD